MLMGERRGANTEALTAHSLDRLSLLPIMLEAIPDETAVLDLARRHHLTFYDAVYLELRRAEESAAGNAGQRT